MSFIQILDPPCELNDIIQLNFSMNNLHKYLNFLLLSDKEAYTKLNEISGKLTQIDDIKTLIKENKQKMYEIDDKFVDIDRVTNNFNNKFIDIDNKFNNTFIVKNKYKLSIKIKIKILKFL
jgi:hypothetical protein